MVWVPKYIVVHHSAGNESLEQLARLRYYHHCVADEPGGPRLLTSVPIDRPTVHAVADGNSICYSLCVAGNFENEQPSLELLRFLVQILASRARAWNVPTDRIVSHGWFGRKIARPRYVTACCGRHLEAQLAYLRGRVGQYL